jgi:hypothetical protein
MEKPDCDKKLLILLIISALISFTLLIFLRISNISPGVDYGVDVYYHIKVSDSFSYFATTKVFPWVEMSILKTNFYDKGIGFHLIIFLLRKFTALFGFSSSAPFNFVSAFFSGSILLIFSTWGYLKCRKTAFIIAPLLVFISPEFFQKLITIRPWLLSIILFSSMLFILLSKLSFNKKIIFTFFMGWLYSLCYSMPHIILIPLFIYFISFFFVSIKKANIKYVLFPIIGLAGILVGLTLHPQFPNTFIISYVQGIAVVLKTLGISSSKVVMATELSAPNTYYLLINIPLFILCACNIFLFISKKNKDQNIIFLFILQLLFLIGYFFSKRCIEYLVPIEVICFSILLSTHSVENVKSYFVKRLSNTKVLFGIIVILILVMIPLDNVQIKNQLKLPTPYYQFGDWQRTHLSKGTYVGLLNWGDFARLFYVAPELKYSMAHDPMFSYYAYPERTNKIALFSMGYDQKITPKELAEAFGTDLIYIPNFYVVAAYYLINKGAKNIYYDNQGCLLQLQ